MLRPTVVLAVFFLLVADVAVAQEDAGRTAGGAARRFVAGIGVELSTFTAAGPLEEDGLTTTGSNIDKSGFDLTLSVEAVVLPWIAAGAAFERLGKVERGQLFDVDGFRRFTTELRDGEFDPSIVELYAMPFWQAGRRLRLFGMFGVGFWRADSSSTLILFFDGDELSRETVMGRNDGTTAVVGAGLDVWPHERLGFRIGYKYLRLGDGDVDQPAHNLRFMALFGF